MATRKFFEERTDQSEVKARIVQKYFLAWARVIIPSASSSGGRIAYFDLYAGPGRYKDGSASTPLMVLESAIQDPQLAKMLVAIFNDANKDFTDTLTTEIKKLPGIEKLKHEPEVLCGEIDEDAEEFFSKTNLIPSFSFVDPFGYKGLSIKIVNGVIKDWGCDCVFFFNYNRINAGISNEAVRTHMDALFGAERANKLRKILPNKTPAQREGHILEELSQAIKEMGGKYVLPFRFKNSAGNRTSHSLIFVSKHFKGYEIMKQIMSKESSVHDQGVPSFSYSPADESMPLLFSLTRPLDYLEKVLPKVFAGRTLRMDDVYKEHNVDTPYIKKNYKQILAKLERRNALTADPPSSKRKANTFADHVVVTFPKKDK